MSSPATEEDGSTSRQIQAGEAAQEAQNGTETPKEEVKKESKIKKLWAKLGLDIGTVMMMFKNSLPPTIGIAFYQAPAVAARFSTLGYLIPIITVLSVSIMPRAKYIQTLILNTIGICLGSAVALLGIWSGVQARIHTTPAGVTASYNSSQAAVCAIWLFANIWFVNLLRAKVPALQFPVIMYSIFTNVAFTYGPLFQTIEQGEALILQLLEGFLTAFAISTAVSLFVIPVSSRTVVFKEQEGYIALIRSTLKAQSAYLQSLEKGDMFSTKKEEGEDASANKKKKVKKVEKDDEKKPAKFEPSPESKALKGAIVGLTGLHGKLHGDLPFGKRDFAWGKLDQKDLDEIFSCFQAILVPLIGMSTITDIFERIAERRGWISSPDIDSKYDDIESWEKHPDAEAKLEEKRLWNEVMKQLHEPFATATEAMDEGLQHAGILLELIPKPKKSKDKDTKPEDADVEANGDTIRPGDAGFADYLDQKMTTFYKGRGETLKTWAREKGLSEKQFDAAKFPLPPDAKIEVNEAAHRRDQQQLYLILYMEHLLYSTGVAITKFVRFAESKVEDGTMKKNRLIFPGIRRIRKWVMSIGSEDSTVDNTTPDSMESGVNIVYMGAGFNGRKDPEHMAAGTAWEKTGNALRAIPRLLGSVESTFGFRVALATMTIGIVAFLEQTQTFFIEQRLVWAMIIIAIGMTVTTGQSVFGFFGRVAGTTLSMIFSMIIWYIVDEKTPGVIVMLWFFIFIEMYFFIKFPRFIPVWLVCIVTQVLIIGYELQVEVIGIQAASASGQPYYPIYELAPYRLACVAGGSAVAFIWTIFPYPLTDRSWLRKDLGATIYLLANYYSVVHSTIGARIHNTEGDMDDKRSPGRQLQKVRQKVFGKLHLMLPSLHQHADWQKWEPSLGGKFPRKTYEAIIQRLSNILNYLSLMSYATQTWSMEGPDSKAPINHKWIDDLSKLLDSIDPTSHHITSILTLLSASVTQGSALPPYMQLPKPYQLSRRLEALDRGILDARHIEEPGYSAYAVMQVTSSLVTDDLKRLVDLVKDLVGEVDFSFRVVEGSAVSEASEASSSTDAVAGVVGGKKGKSD